MSIDPVWFREVLGWYPTGVTTVMAVDPGGQPIGMVVGTFTSVSLDPPLVGFLPAHTSTTWPKIQDAARFCINVLGADQEELCRAIASKDPARMQQVRWRPAEGSGSPILEGAVAWIDCALHSVQEVGDHFFVAGEVLALDVQAGTLPLLFFQGGYGAFSTRSMATPDPSMAEELRAVDLARPFLERLAQTHSAKANASVMIGDQIVMVATAGNAAPTSHAFVGRRVPAVGPVAALFCSHADEATLERWLAHAETDDERAELLRRVRDIRERGYSISVREGGRHAEFEQMWRNGEVASRPEDLSTEARKIIATLPYDPAGASLERFEDIRSLHAPVLDGSGHVALSLSLVPDRHGPRSPEIAQRWAEDLLAVAAEVTSLLDATATAAPGADAPTGPNLHY
jgi:flavin reductase (DIM6/NTAB) family NADH-FMN oxidoreductase RutF/DNA-binding IclR family transcriptional regulator